MIKITESEFIKRLTISNPKLTLIGNYINNRTKVKVKDNLGIIYLVSPKSLLTGKFPTIRLATDTNKAFELRAKKIHGNKYDYSKYVYHGVTDKSIIICPHHGEFKQHYHHHISIGTMCPKCSKEFSGWENHKWVECGLHSTRFDSFKIYLIRCWNDTEEFYKIGKTFNTIPDRFKKSQMPYNYEIISVKKGFTYEEGLFLSKLEHRAHRFYKKHAYLPKIKFGGMFECFK